MPCLIPEPTGGTITRAHTGTLWFRLRVRGVPVHVMMARPGRTPSSPPTHLIRALQDHTVALNRAAESDPWFGGDQEPDQVQPRHHPRRRLGVLAPRPGARWTAASACRRAWRWRTSWSGWSAASRGGAAGDNFLANNPPEITWHGFQADGYVLEPGTEAERVLAAAHEAVFGAPMEERRSTAVNDTRFYGRYFNIPALCYGPTGEGAHGFDERTNLDDLRQTTLAIAAFIADWCGALPT